MLSIDRTGPRWTDRYDEYLGKGHLTYVGKFMRSQNLKPDVEVRSTAFTAYLQFRGLDESIASTHRQIISDERMGMRSVAKYDRPEGRFDWELLQMANEYCYDHFFSYVRGSGVISLESAISFATKTTAAGYPHNRYYHSKREYFDGDDGKALHVYWEELSKLVKDPTSIACTIWNISRKRELRSDEKIKNNKVRTFCASAVEQSISSSRLSYEFNQRFYDTSGQHWSFVGGSKYFRGFDHLHRRLSRHPNGWALDVGDFDASIIEQLLMMQCEMRIDAFDYSSNTIGNQNRMRNLYHDIVHSVMILENGEVVQKHTGNPSGQGNTIVDNTMILYRLFAYAWIKLAVEAGVIVTPQMFHSNVEAALNGDDNTFTVSDRVVKWFNGPAVARVLGDAGVKITADDWAPRKAECLDFLSQKFVYDDGMWLPSPDTGRVLSSLLWGTKIDDPRWHLLRACALRLESWPNRECREIISDYIDFILKNFAPRLCGSVVLQKGVEIPMSEIRAMIRPDSWIRDLYTGFESGGDVISADPDKKFGVSYTVESLNDLEFAALELDGSCAA